MPASEAGESSARYKAACSFPEWSAACRNLLLVATTYLSGIVAAHREYARSDDRDLDTLLAVAKSHVDPEPVTSFSRALLPPGEPPETRVIAEIKRRSPSKGDLAPDLDPARLAKSYAVGGASCLSVLTDKEFFGGSPEDLKTAKEASGLPALRKDFTVSERDLADARIMGADAVLLIVAALSDDELGRFLALGAELALDCLVEVHDREELDRALCLGAGLVGVNQRDLRTFDVDTDAAFRLAAHIPESVIAVAESGIRGADDVKKLAASGYQAVLIGESLVTSGDPVSVLEQMTRQSVGSRVSA